MKLTPLADRVVLKMTEPEETTKGGIILTGSAKEKPSVAEVISVGPGGTVDGKTVVMSVKAGDKVLIMPGDNSSVPTMRNDGFFSVLKENGWTEEQIAAIQSTDYTGWSRSKGKELFINWLDASTVEDITATKWIFTHDDEIAMGILEALKSSEIDAEKKDAFLNAGVHLGTSSGLNEIYSVLKGIHQKDYTAEVAKLADLFSVTYDPADDQVSAVAQPRTSFAISADSLASLA